MKPLQLSLYTAIIAFIAFMSGYYYYEHRNFPTEWDCIQVSDHRHSPFNADQDNLGSAIFEKEYTCSRRISPTEVEYTEGEE